MAKKLKKKIEEICGLVELDWEARQARASEILNNNSWKQQLCNELVGLSFRDLERVLTGVANERQAPDEEKVYKNEKLRAYRDNKLKSVRGGSRKFNGQHSSKSIHHQKDKPQPRSLEEILSQVYAPRVSLSISEEDRKKISSFRRNPSNEELFPDSSYDDSEPNE